MRAAANRSIVDFVQRRSLVHRDVVGPVAPDFILRIFGTRVVNIALVVGVTLVDLDDRPADLARFGIPSDVVAYIKTRAYRCSP